MHDDLHIWLKIIAGTVLTIGPIVFAVIPFMLTRFKNMCCNQRVIMQVLDILNGFAGGTLLATGFIHLLRKYSIKSQILSS
jgi:zinc transporter ZupT